MSADELKRKFSTFIYVRLLFITLLFGSFLFLDIQIRQFYYSQILYLLIVLSYTPSLVFLFLRKRLLHGRSLRLFAYTHHILDVFFVIFLIVITGGIESWYSFLLMLITISGSIVLGRRAGFLLATTGSLIYGLTVDLQFYGVIPVLFNPLLEVKEFFYNIFIHVSGLYLSAYLMGYLVYRLERTSESLQRKDIDLRELYRFHSEVIENIPSGLFTTDNSYNITLFNSAAERITGLERDMAIGLRVNGILPFLEVPLKTGRHHGVIQKGDDMIYLGVNVSVNRDSNGLELGFIGTFQDLTSIVRMEEEIRHKEKLAAIGELSANIAHELRNPIASIKGSVEMLKEGRVSKQTRTRLMDIAINEMERLNRIVTDFLLYCHPRAPEFTTFNMTDIINEVTDMVLNLNNGMRIKKTVPDELYIEADEQKMRQLLWNLARNAVEAAGASGEMDISATRDSGSMILRVRDSGPGISREDLKRIFYPFFSKKKEGTGLGLSIAYTIVEEHHGKIDVFSERGAGTEFVVTIPLKRTRTKQQNG